MMSSWRYNGCIVNFKGEPGNFEIYFKMWKFKKIQTKGGKDLNFKGTELQQKNNIQELKIFPDLYTAF